MMKIFKILIVMSAVLICNCSYGFEPLSKISVVVLNEFGRPVDDASVSVSFEKDSPKNLLIKKIITNKDGIISVVGSTLLGTLHFSVTKDGYYKYSNSFKFKEAGFGRWKPWNPQLKIVLRKIENPVPMYARDTRYARLEIPTIGERVGFDLVKFDWLPPYGNGLSPDVYFSLEKQMVTDTNYSSSLTVSFGGEYNGIQSVKNEFGEGGL